MAFPSNFDTGKCLPTEDDFKQVAKAKNVGDRISARGNMEFIMSSEAPCYYRLIRRFITCILLSWPEAANECKELLNNVAGFDSEDLRVLIGAIRLSSTALTDLFNKYKQPAASATTGTAENKGVKLATRGDTKDFYRIIAYDTRYGGSGARRLISFGPKVGNIYSLKVLSGDQISGSTSIKKEERLYDLVFFKTVREAESFISRIDHDTIKTKYELESFRYSISDAPIENYHYYGGTKSGFEISSLDDAVQVWTPCGLAYMLKKSAYFNESLTENKMPYTIVGYGSVGTRKDSAYDLGSAKDRAEKMLQDKFVQKVDILQQNNLVWSSKPAPAVVEAVEKHETLNPKLFDGMELKQEVKDKIEDITNTMIKLLNEEEIKLEVRDVIMTGSNASYNYTKDSDIDVHILAKTSNLNDPDKIYPKLYNAYRRIFANKYDISFYGIPVEVYIEVEGNETVSNGSYSVMFDHWVKEPSATAIPEIDQKAIDEAAKPWKKEAEELLKKEDLNGIDEYIKRIYELRQKGLYSSEGVEFSTENLIFKEVRNAGLLDKLKEHRDALVSKELSLESLEEAIDEKTRRDYVVQITRLTHYQPVVHPNGQFEIHLVKEDDIQYVLTILRRQNWVQDCHSVPGKFDFSHVSSFSLPARYHTVMGKIRD